MLYSGNFQDGVVTMSFSIHGEAKKWMVSVRAPGQTELQGSSSAVEPFDLLKAMIAQQTTSVFNSFPNMRPRPTLPPLNYGKQQRRRVAE
jgi:hypothetical protein